MNVQSYKKFKKIKTYYNKKLVNSRKMSRYDERFFLTKKKKEDKLLHKEGEKMTKQINSVQEWLPFERILINGIIKLKDSTYIKILKITPINFNLKSELEKDAILNSYKIFLKTCNFDIQILIQSNKEDLSKNILKIKNQQKTENEKIKNISENYIQYIKELNKGKKSSNKNFYIIIKNPKEIQKIENVIIDELNDKYYKIKECLSRCGNVVKDINQKEEIKETLASFINRRNYLQNK